VDAAARSEVIRRIFAMIDSRDYGLMPELVDPAFVEHSPMGDLSGHEGFIGYLETFRAAFGQLHHDVSDIKWLDAATAVWQIRFRGSFTGEFMGQRGAGQPVDVYVANAGRFRDGRAVEHWGPMEEAMGAIMQQMGLGGA
jgi:predicted ester cyclase